MRKQPYSQSNMASGLVTSLDPTLISAKDSPNVLNTRLSRGLLAKDFALTPFGLPVLGYPMLQDLYHQDNGTRSYILITTTSVYIWEGTVSEWVDITEGLDIENCEAAWDDLANVVSSAVEDAKEGTYATKFAIAEAFTTGRAATNVISAVNLDGVTHVHLWVKSSIALNAGDIQLLLDNTAACVSPLETLDIPALEANTWTRVSIALSNPAADLAIISVGLRVAKNKGAMDITLDHIRGVKELTGTIDDLVSGENINDDYVFTNFVDVPKKIEGTTISNLGGTPPKAKWLTVFANRVVLCGVEAAGTFYPRRVQWSDAGTHETWTGGTSGWVDVIDTNGWAVCLKKLGSTCFLYKTDSIWELSYVGGTRVFNPVLIVNSIGVTSPATVQDEGRSHLLFSTNNVYRFDGTININPVGSQIKDLLFETATKIVDLSYPYRIKGKYVKEEHFYYLVVPVDSDTPNTLFRYDTINDIWVRKNTQPITCWGEFQELSDPDTWVESAGVTWEDSEGPWLSASLIGSANVLVVGYNTGQMYQDTRAYLDSSEFTFETKDFIFAHASRVTEIRVNARKGAFYVSYSTDGGVTYSAEKTFAYQDDWSEYCYFLNITTQRIRAKIRTTATNIEIRSIEPWFIPRQKSINSRRF